MHRTALRGIRGVVLALATTTFAGHFARVPPIASAEDAPSSSTPLPLTGRQTVRAAGKTYVIDGKQVIPGGSIIRVEANVRILGINNASLDIRGGLLVHGTMDCWVTIENVDFSPTVAPDNEFHLDMATLRDCTLVHGEAASFDGGMTIENSCLQSGCKFGVRMRSGYLRIMTTEFKMPCAIESRPEKGRLPEIAVRTCWMKDMSIRGSATAVFRNSEFRGTIDARDFTDLIVDGCDLFSDVGFHLQDRQSFSKLQLLKCNLLAGSKLTLDRPAGPTTTKEKVRLDKFYFGDSDDKPALTDKAIAERIADGADDDKLSVRAFWLNPQERRHVFVSDTLRRRAPPAPE